MTVAKPLIAAKVEPNVKAAFADLARRSGRSESDLLRDILAKVLGGNPSPAPLQAGFKNGTGKFVVRLRADELAAVGPLAKADSRSIPAWIVSLVRRVALQAVPFNESELQSVNRAIAALGPIGRNLNVLAKHFHQTGRARPDDLPVAQLTEAVARLRAEVIALAERASRRYSETDE